MAQARVRRLAHWRCVVPFFKWPSTDRPGPAGIGPQRVAGRAIPCCPPHMAAPTGRAGAFNRPVQGVFKPLGASGRISRGKVAGRPSWAFTRPDCRKPGSGLNSHCLSQPHHRALPRGEACVPPGAAALAFTIVTRSAAGACRRAARVPHRLPGRRWIAAAIGGNHRLAARHLVQARDRLAGGVGGQEP